VGQPVERGHGVEILLIAARLELRVRLAQVVAEEPRVAPHAPREQPAHSAPYASTVRPCRPAYGRTSFSIAPLEQVVRRLHDVQRRDRPEGLHLLGREVAHADRADCPVLVEPPQLRRGLLHRNERIGPVHLIDVDVARSQPPQRVLDLRSDPLRGGVAVDGAGMPCETGLGSDQHALAPAVLSDGRPTSSSDLPKP